MSEDTNEDETKCETTEQGNALSNLKDAYETVIEHGDVVAYVLIAIDSKGEHLTGISLPAHKGCVCCLAPGAYTLLGMMTDAKQKILGSKDYVTTIDHATADTLEEFRGAFETTEEANLWVDTPLDSHDGKTPLELLEKGEGATVQDLLAELAKARESSITESEESGD